MTSHGNERKNNMGVNESKKLRSPIHLAFSNRLDVLDQCFPHICRNIYTHNEKKEEESVKVRRGQQPSSRGPLDRVYLIDDPHLCCRESGVDRTALDVGICD